MMDVVAISPWSAIYAVTKRSTKARQRPMPVIPTLMNERIPPDCKDIFSLPLCPGAGADNSIYFPSGLPLLHVHHFTTLALLERRDLPCTTEEC
jgi:hypothetical protein